MTAPLPPPPAGPLPCWPPLLVADIGGTNARFALIGPEGIRDIHILACADHPTLEAAVRAYLAATAPAEPPRQAAFAVAGPVTGDWFAMTNHIWSFSVTQTRQSLGLDRLELINDFTAVALAVPHLTSGDRQQIGTGSPETGASVGIIGPGSGLGVSGLVMSGSGWTPLTGEGGHVTMAPVTERESAVLTALRQRFGHVSAERVISGQGLVNLYETLSVLDGRRPMPHTPAEITAAALAACDCGKAGDPADASDPACVEAVDMFCAMLGTITGNLALTLGARGGVYIAGGIVPKLGPVFVRSCFRERFVGKGRLRDYLEPIPTYVITHELPAFLGLKALLDA